MSRLPAKPKPGGATKRAIPGAAWVIGMIERRKSTQAVKLLRDATLEAQRTKLPQMAAALSYRTVFGLIPVLVVALVAMKLFFTTEDEIADVLNRAMRYSGISSIAASPVQSPEAMGPFPEEAEYQPPQSPDEKKAGGGSAGSTRPEVVPTEHPPATPEQEQVAKKSAERLDQWIKDVVRRVSAIDFKTIGLIGGIALIYAAISMLVEVERTFNQIYRVPVGRSWARRVVNYWALLTLGALGLFLSFYVTEQFSQRVGDMLQHYRLAGSAILLALIGYASTVSISLVMFMLIYTVVPNTRIQVSAALSGAAIAAIAWEASKWGFTQYLKFSSGYAKLYGSIALIPLFLLWVYVTWYIVLFGLNVAYYIQHGRFHTAAQAVDVPEPTIVDPAATLSLMTWLARRFQVGKAAEVTEVSCDLKLPARVCRDMFGALVGAGMVHRVQRESGDGNDEPVYTLSMPPERIAAEDVLKVADGLMGASVSGPTAEALRKARREALKGQSLQALIADGGAPAPNPDCIAPGTPPAAVPASPTTPPAAAAPKVRGAGVA